MKTSELERITEVRISDEKVFNKLYKTCLPVIKNLSRNLDCRKLGISIDLVESMFMDKFLYIYNKYAEDYEYEKLKAFMLNGLKRYAYRLMKDCYSKQADFNSSICSFEDLFDDSKEDEDATVNNPLDNIIDEKENTISFAERLKVYMEKALTPDEYLIYRIILDPPLFIRERMQESKGKLAILHLIDYFEFPRDKRSYNHFNLMKAKVYYTLEKAKVELR